MVLKIMSNEYKDYLYDRATDLVLERGLADKVLNTSTGRFVDGFKDNQPVRFEVWFDDKLEEWRVERRELEK
jgi:hypothetical protein